MPADVQVTAEEAVAMIVGMTSLTADDVRGILACSPEELVPLVKAYRDAGAITEKSTWERIVGVLRTASEFAGMALPILNAVQVVFAL